MNGWEHLFHFTQDGNTEIDLEQSGVPYGPGPTNPRYKADAIMSKEILKEVVEIGDQPLLAGI